MIGIPRDPSRDSKKERIGDPRDSKKEATAQFLVSVGTTTLPIVISSESRIRDPWCRFSIVPFFEALGIIRGALLLLSLLLLFIFWESLGSLFPFSETLRRDP